MVNSNVEERPAPRRPPTMRDIANAAGVAQSTVSRVLNNAASPVSIAPETRERILEAAARLGYRPNPLARALRGAPTMLIGAIVRDITDPFFARAIEALYVEAIARGYNVVLGHAHGRATEALALATVLETRHCDAIILLGDIGDQPRLVEDLQDTRVPVVGVWQGSRIHGIPSVNVDNRFGIRLALDHVTDCGHRRIAFVGGRPLGDIQERREAFLEYMSEVGLAVHEGWIERAENTPEGGEFALRALLELPDRPTAVLAATDVLAIGVLHWASEAGLSIPTGLSVVGFDDIALAAYTVPPLTTLRMPTAEMIAEAVRIAMDEASLPEAERGPSLRVLRPALVVRGSTARPSADFSD